MTTLLAKGGRQHVQKSDRTGSRLGVANHGAHLCDFHRLLGVVRRVERDGGAVSNLADGRLAYQ